MKITNIKTPHDILNYFNENITYGWIGFDGEKHIQNMKDFRKLYRISSLEEVLETGIGTCIEQVYLMNSLMEKIDVKSKMFCTRMYEDETFNDLDAPERMHCFLLFYIDDKVYQLEHPDSERAGIYEYESEDVAIKKIVSAYEKMMAVEYISKNKPVPDGGFERTTTEFFEVEPGLSYKEFNLYINSLDEMNYTIK